MPAVGRCTVPLSWSQLNFLPDIDPGPTFLSTALQLTGVGFGHAGLGPTDRTYTLDLRAVRIATKDKDAPLRTRTYNPIYQHLLDDHLRLRAGVPPATVRIPGYPGHWYLFATPPLEPSDGTPPHR